MEPPRTCSRCRRTLAASAFPLRRKGGQARQSHCRDCKAAYQAAWYRANEAAHKARVAQTRRVQIAANRRLIRLAKQRPCADCGQSYPAYVMDFDHVRGKKRGAVSALMVSVSADRLREEIAKCEVVCANCHRERTFRSSVVDD